MLHRSTVRDRFGEEAAGARSVTTARRQRFWRGSGWSSVLAALVAGALLLAGCTSSLSPPASPTSEATATATAAGAPPGGGAAMLPDTPAGAQARWLVAATRRLPIPEAELRAHINAALLSVLTPAEINQALESVGPLTPVAIGASLPWLVVFEASTDSAEGVPPRVGVGIAVTSNGSIGDLSSSSTPPSMAPASPTTWDGVDAMLRSVAPQVRLLVADVTSGACRPIHAIDSATAAPIASAFKLYVLAALATAVRSGRLSWDQQLTLTPRVKSLAGGVLQYEPDATRVSVRDAAAHMIAISDNTATDLLISALGRPAVEAALTATGMADPSPDEPFLTTRESFLLYLHQWPTLARRYVVADAATRRRLLASVVDPAPLPDRAAVTALPARAPMARVGWFATMQDVCRAYVWLAQQARQPGLAPIGSVLGANDGGLALDRATWQRTWFKGGFGGTVIAMTYLATTRTGRSYVVAAEAEDRSYPLPDAAAAPMLAAIRAAFTLAATA